ncbi:bifunctional apoptosis regulator-like [Xyrauchen texanus]|uniref:bifunctional apoptosis regulator-like n=1 Tax=Xyrauchen texanus TaxID=154827 RepID=UPI00224258BE|nr:bifunctional apoptosis regulator-like [Xyrauchen texanus]
MTDVCITIEPDFCESVEDTGELSAHEFTCHCCYEVLVDPTTLNCGHSFCRHCLALWLHSSQRTECPECRERWQGFPKVNILLRDMVEKKFPADVSRRRSAVQSDPRFRHVLQAFQQYGQTLTRHVPVSIVLQQAVRNGFYSGVLMALICVGVLFLRYHWTSADSDHDALIRKPISRWNADDVNLWVEHLGPWTNQYRETFHRGRIKGSLLTRLGDEELSAAPFRIENPSHRRVILEEIQRIKDLGVKLPQNLWEYKAANFGKSLFLLIGLRDFPRLTLLYMYLFDYDDTFLPFIHTCCPAHTNNTEQDVLPDNMLQEPSWRQWVQFLVKYALLPYQLLMDFAWDWLSVHYWTSRFVIVNAAILSLHDFYFWTLWRTGQMRMLLKSMWEMLWFVLLWPVVPQCICNFVFYCGLYFSPIIHIILMVKICRNPDLLRH